MISVIGAGLAAVMPGALGPGGTSGTPTPSPTPTPTPTPTPAPSLNALSTSGTFQIGSPVNGLIYGATSGSTIVGNIPGIVVDSVNRTYAGTPTGSAATISNALVETLAGASNSPRSTSLSVAASGANKQTNVPAGYDVVAVLGDSLSVSRGSADRSSPADDPVPNAYQFENFSFRTGTYQTIQPSVVPLWHSDNPSDYGTAPYADRNGPGEHLARRYASYKLAANRRLLMVPCGTGGTKLSLGWNPTPGSIGTYLAAMVTTTTAALAAARDTANGGFAGSRIVGFNLDVLSNDVNGGTYDDTSTRVMLGLIVDYIRTNVPEASEAWFVLGGLIVPGATGNLARASLAYTATQKTNTFFVMPPYPADPAAGNLHPIASENRTWGRDMSDAIQNAAEPQKVLPFTSPNTFTNQSGVAIDTDITSNTVMIRTGAGVAVSASITGGTFSVNGGTFVSSATSLKFGDLIAIKLHSSTSNNTALQATLTVTGPVDSASTSFSVTTIASSGTTRLRFVSATTPMFINDNGSFRITRGARQERP